MMNLNAFSLKLAVCAALALCLAAGSATTAAAENVIVGGGTGPAYTLPAWYPGHPTYTIVGGHDPYVYKVTTPVCGSGWYWDSTQRRYTLQCRFLKFKRLYTAWTQSDYLVGEGFAYYYSWNGKTYCWGSHERPYSWTVWPTNSWTAGFCPRYV
jgi:hypothetical protein